MKRQINSAFTAGPKRTAADWFFRFRAMSNFLEHPQPRAARPGIRREFFGARPDRLTLHPLELRRSGLPKLGHIDFARQRVRARVFAAELLHQPDRKSVVEG